MKVLSKLSLVFFMGLSLSGIAQASKITIGKSTTNSLEKAKPAQLIATFPRNDTIDNNWLVDGFVEYSRTDIVRNMEIGVFAEIHKNTLLTKEQDAKQFGLNIKRVFAIEEENWVWFNTTLNLRHSNDRVKQEEAFQGILATTVQLITVKDERLRFLRAQTALINEEGNFSDYLNISHNHSFGFGLIGGEEDIVLFNGSFDLNIFPLSTMFYKKKKRKMEGEIKVSEIKDSVQSTKTKVAIEKEARRFANLFVLKGTIKGRELISGSTDTDLNTFIRFSGGVNYNFTEESAIGIMYGWQTGADPYTTLSDQTFSSITATLKLSL
ncbi:hypothetical protein [Flagellimonas sp.]|uniref:hypothetical protein n=1 Tax=Flagellimonas sp. TaxID=2058762 RepID=UPI003F4A4B6C